MVRMPSLQMTDENQMLPGSVGLGRVELNTENSFSKDFHFSLQRLQKYDKNIFKTCLNPVTT